MRKEKIKICQKCSSEFSTDGNNVKFCSKECRDIYNNDKKYEGKVEGMDYIICQLCHHKVERIFGQHIRLSHPDKTEADYKKEFPNAPLYCENDKKQFAKSSGKHMKTEKYRKLYSEMTKGDKNRNHKNNTTELQRKERSPYCIEFWIKRGYNEDYAKDKISKFAKMNKQQSTTLKYWLEKTDGDLEEAKRLLKERQSTFSLEKCIEKYGEIKGTKRWQKRQEKWLKNYKKNNFSKISQDLFLKIYDRIKGDFNEIYFATLNENNIIDNSGKNYEFRLSLKNKVILPDFFIKDINKIIEFDGAYWHGKYQSDKTNVSREKERDVSIIENGYKIHHVSELNYYKDKEGEIQKCLDFIYDI
jgi:very-short-patch-repair endonuclease